MKLHVSANCEDMVLNAGKMIPHLPSPNPLSKQGNLLSSLFPFLPLSHFLLSEHSVREANQWLAQVFSTCASSCTARGGCYNLLPVTSWIGLPCESQEPIDRDRVWAKSQSNVIECKIHVGNCDISLTLKYNAKNNFCGKTGGEFIQSNQVPPKSWT